jgi:trimethylamine-N-oxide reductase (cytochrome c)
MYGLRDYIDYYKKTDPEALRTLERGACSDEWYQNEIGGFSFNCEVPMYRSQNISDKTPSGKIEFYAQNLAKYFPDDKERPPVPHWIPYGESQQESLLHPRARIYPLLIVSNHGRWRMHANHDDITWTRANPHLQSQGSRRVPVREPGR